MPKVHKSAAEARDHLRDIVPKIAERYKAGTARAAYAEGAASDEAEANFAVSMSAAIAAKSRQSACREAEPAYKRGCADKGAPIIGARITLSLDKYLTNFGTVYGRILPIVDALPRRGLDAMANIDARLKPTVAAWIANKLKR